MSYTGPLNPNPAPDESKIIIYNYIPSLALQIIAIIVFAVGLIGHSIYAVRYKVTRTFELLLAFGCVMELVGYGFRLKSHYNPFLVYGFVVNYFFIVCAPIFIAAALYWALSLIAKRDRIEEHLPLRPRLVLAIFITCDVITIAVQIAGAALVGVTESNQARGNSSISLTSKQANDILLAGLVAQCASFLTFIVVLSLTIKRCLSSQITRSTKRQLYLLAFTSVLLFMRTLFRLAETAQGVFGYAYSHESLFGVFEFAPVAVVILAFLFLPLHRSDHQVIDGGQHFHSPREKLPA